jgi:hypothetical protein
MHFRFNTNTGESQISLKNKERKKERKKERNIYFEQSIAYDILQVLLVLYTIFPCSVRRQQDSQRF